MALTTDKFIIPNGAASLGVQKMTSSTVGLDNLWDFGIFDYRDQATSTTPISVTGGVEAIITNDAADPETYKKLPDTGVTDLWNASLNRFEFSTLTIGDMIDIRLDLQVTTTVNNQTFSIDLELGQGGTTYRIPFIVNQEKKTFGATSVIRYNGFYIKDTNTLNNYAQFKILSASNLTVEVHGWYMKLMKQGR